MLAFTFPGQGSQRPAMGAAWEGHQAWSRVEEAAAATGVDVAHLLLRANADELTETQNAQLATFVTSMMAFDAATSAGLAKVQVMAGHSLGEYSALVAAGILDFADGAKLVNIRGQAMKRAAAQNPGTMYAVLGLDGIKVEAACRQASAETEAGDAFVANYNSDGQLVISGSQQALERAGEIAKQMGAKRSVPLPVGGAFHTPHMAPAQQSLSEALQSIEFRESHVKVVSNFDAHPHLGGPHWRELCAQQLCNPVRWSQSVETITSMGATVYAELGPGNVLTNLAKRNAPNATALSVQTPDVGELADAVATLDQSANGFASTETNRDGDDHLGDQPGLVDHVITAAKPGAFAINESLQVGQQVEAGDEIATVDNQVIQSPFAGTLARVIARQGERVTPGKPLIWISAPASSASASPESVG